MKIAEIFKSIQGEGPMMGRPCVFLRVGGCTLDCPECDSAEVWKNPVEMDEQQILNELELKGRDLFLRKNGRLILTGGSPLRVQKDLARLLSRRPVWMSSGMIGGVEIEVETECMVLPCAEIDRFVNQYNVSPKIGEFGRGQNMNGRVLEWHVDDPRSIFKFVVTNKDLHNVKRFIDSAAIHCDRVWLMPMASSREQLDKVSKDIVDFAVENHYNYSHRLQLSIWDKATGV